MKHTKKTLGTMLLSVAVLTSCADMDPLGFNAFEKPANIEGMEYLADYDALKEYKSLNSSVSPDFKLGMALSANDYNANGMWTRLANANFDEVVAGNEMKMGSVVNNKGEMDFGTVENFVRTARENQIGVYGHTLAWHSQQPTTWLTSLLADKPDPDYSGEEVLVEVKEQRRCIRIDSDNLAEAAWDTQFWLYFPNDVIAAGDSYEFSVDLLANKAATAGSQTHKDPGGYIHWAGVGTLDFKEEWSTYKSTGTFAAESAGGYSIAFNLNDFAEANIYYLDNISLKINGKEVIKNGDCEGTDVSSFYSKEKRGATGPSTIVDETVVYRLEKQASTKEVDYPRNCILVESDDMVEAAWDTQFWLYFPNDVIAAGDSYEFSIDVFAQHNATSGSQTHKNPGGYIHWAGVGSLTFDETDWTTYKSSGTFAAESGGGYSIAFNLNDFAGANKYYFDNISLKINGKEVIQNGDCEDPNNTVSFYTKEKRGETVNSRIVDHYTKIVSSEPTIPLTPEERKEAMEGALDLWISGMMNACKDEDGSTYVKAWDVVNEPISGGNPDTEGVFALHHADDGCNNGKGHVNADEFVWQDELGDLDYVRTVVAKAREYGGNDLKLFINDYNLESDWDDNQKLKSLIAWIKRWEADGVTKIDGIGTQMHLSYYSDPNVQASKEKHITEMFKLLAASGKLVRVSELDIEFKDEQGNNVVVENMTDAQLRKVSDFYKWIIQQYIANVPAAQQYGFCIWTAIDADPSTSWTHNQLYGLWNKNFNRTHAYAGFADGLGGK